MLSIDYNRYLFTLFVIILALFSCVFTSKTFEKTCLYLDHARNGNDDDKNSCSESYVCNKTYTINYVEMPPYDLLFSVEDSMLKKCCGKCANVSLKSWKKYLHEIKELFQPISTNSPDFIFPVLAKSTTIHVHGYHFIPVVRLPSMIYVTPIRQSAFERAVISCINLYPLLLIGFLMSLVFGFIIWILETWVNAEEFPRSFPIGWIKGFWWSVVTMASTGLERTPKSILARILSVIWIVTGVIMLGLLTSSITAAIIKPTPIPNMDGAKVGSLMYRDYDAYMITKRGGNVVKYAAPDVYREFYRLIERFYLGDIDGVLIDKYTLSYATKFISNIRGKMGQNKALEYFTTNTVLTEKKDEENMSFGVLIKDIEVYKYFRDGIKENWLYYETLFAEYVNNITEDEKNRRARIKDFTAPLFSPSDPYVYYAMATFTSIILLIAVFGILNEMRRRKYSPCKSTPDVSRVELHEA